MFPRAVVLSYLALGALSIIDALRPGLPFPRPPAGTYSAPARKPTVEFVTTGPIEISQTDKGAASTTVLVRNAEETDVDVRFEVALKDRTGAALTASAGGGGPVKRGQVGVVPVTVTPTPAFARRWDARLPASGSLMMMATAAGASKDAMPAMRYRDMLILQIRPARAEIIVSVAGLLPAFLLLAWGLARSADALPTVPTAATPAWTPQSWSSNLAIGGTLLSALLAISALPAHTHYMARSSYTVLNLFFGALVALAPPMYGLLKAGGRPTPQGALRLFTAAAAITLWATVGQFGTAAVVFMELAAASAISWTSALAAIVVVGGVAMVVAVYAFRAVASYLMPARPQAPAGGQPHPPPAPGRPWALI